MDFSLIFFGYNPTKLKLSIIADNKNLNISRTIIHKIKGPLMLKSSLGLTGETYHRETIICTIR